MRLQFLGTGGYHPNERRHTACLMLPEIGVILDAGTSFFRVAERLATPEVDIFLTHSHLDHIVGLTYFLVPMYAGKVTRATVHSAPEYLEAVQQHLFAKPVFPVLPGYEYRPLADEVPLASGGVLRRVRLKHPGGAIGYRLDWPDRSLAYITDTTAGDGSYLDFIRGVDVLVHECNFPDAQTEFAAKTGHSSLRPVAELARDAGVGRLILIHIDPENASDDPIGLAEGRAIFPQMEIAEDLLEIEF